MKEILIGLCALSFCAGLAPKISAQTVTITVGPATDDSYWLWNDEYQVWVWNGPEFEGDYQGIRIAIGTVVMRAAEICSHRSGKARAVRANIPSIKTT